MVYRNRVPARVKVDPRVSDSEAQPTRTLDLQTYRAIAVSDLR